MRYLNSQAGAEIAGKIGLEIYDRIQILSIFPESGSMLPEKSVPEWRKLIVRTWKVAYRIEFDAHTVYIARIWHVSRDEIELPD